jgi:hypothetical protein
VPFTPTHVAAVVPFWPWRRWLPFAALATGAMIPDVPLFFPVIDYAQTHSVVGVWTVCLPLGMTAFLLFESVVRRPLTALLPRWVESRLPAESSLPTQPRFDLYARYFAGVALAIVMGATTHVAWDAFTHEGRWGTEMVPALNASAEIGALRLPGYKLFQYGSTLVGLPMLAGLAAWELQRRTPDSGRTAQLPFAGKLLAASLTLAVPLFVGLCAWTEGATAYEALGLTIKRSGAILLTGLLAYGIWFEYRRVGGVHQP